MGGVESSATVTAFFIVTAMRLRSTSGKLRRSALVTEKKSDPETDSDDEKDEKEVLFEERKFEETIVSTPDLVTGEKTVSLRSVSIRTMSAIFMTILYLLMLQAGHFYCILVGFISQIELFRELVNVRYVEAKARAMPLFRTLQWSWFVLAMSYVYGIKLKNFCVHHTLHTVCIYINQIPFLLRYFTFLMFLLFCVIFMATVLTFRRDLIRFQISQVFWTIVIIVVVVFQCTVFISNTMNGLFWFFFPMATVVMNDVAAYFCGITLGRKFIKRPFLSISPNKTWEGFIGAGILTTIFSFFFPVLLSRWKWFTCPLQNGLHVSPLPPPIECELSPVFVATEYNIMGTNFEILPIQLHGIFYGLFASVVSPFGGFFASAIKRAYNKKDFDSFMPGHGGLVDRMDCQIVMIVFSYFHYQTFINNVNRLLTVGYIDSLLSEMTIEDQQKIFESLQISLSKDLSRA